MVNSARIVDLVQPTIAFNAFCNAWQAASRLRGTSVVL
jgi:hypothetical protein